jgi:hypothetical protein
MLKRILLTIAIALFVTTTAAGQQPKTASAEQPTPAPSEQPAPKAPEPAPQLVNIKIEFTITDQAGPGAPSKKVVSMIAADRQNNSIRSSANVRVAESGADNLVTGFSYREVRINVDVRPILQRDGKISLNFGLEYLPKSVGSAGAEEGMRPGMSSLNERMGLILESGKPMIASQAADPTSDRRITVEVVATILR